MSKTFSAVITTVYTIHADSSDEAVKSMREVLTGGIFRDNVVIKEQICKLVDQNDPLNQHWSPFDPDVSLVAASYFRTGKEQLG